MQIISGTQIAPQPADYGFEPVEGRKFFPYTLNFATDLNWTFDFTMAEQRKQFTRIQGLIWNGQLNTGAGVDIYCNGAKLWSVGSGGNPLNNTLFFPLFGKSPCVIQILGRTGAVGTAVAVFVNFPLFGPASQGSF